MYVCMYVSIYLSIYVYFKPVQFRKRCERVQFLVELKAAVLQFTKIELLQLNAETARSARSVEQLF